MRPLAPPTLLAALLLLLPVGLAAQASGSALARLRLFPGITVTGTQDLAFGNIASTAVKTVAANGGGRFSIQGQANTPVVVQFTQLPASLGANLALGAWTGLGNRAPGAGGATAFVPVAGGTHAATLSTNGRYFIWLGATLTATGALAGTYSTPIVITVGYN